MLAKLHRQLLAAVLTTASLANWNYASAELLRTYEFVNEGPSSIRFGGGLISGRSYARPHGTFDVSVEADGSATISRFDVTLVNVVVESNGASLFSEGESLENYFFGVNPIGLSRQYTPLSLIEFSSHPKPSAPIVSRSSYLYISLESTMDNEVSVNIRASPPTFLDNPSLSTTEFGSRAMLVSVPEPNTLTMVAVVFLVIACTSSYRRYTIS